LARNFIGGFPPPSGCNQSGPLRADPEWFAASQPSGLHFVALALGPETKGKAMVAELDGTPSRLPSTDPKATSGE
jgi:hypothetical protein